MSITIVLIIIAIILSFITIYQTKIILKSKKDILESKHRISNIENNIDEIVEKKRQALKLLEDEIIKLQQKASYIRIDQAELNKEYKYLKDRNQKLENNILSFEETERYRENREKLKTDV